MFIIPINCRENIIIIKPATILNVCEFCKNICPKNDAAAPNIIKTNEKPNVNSINGIKFIFFFSSNSFKEAPEIKDIQPGIKGRTQGDKKLIKPAPNAIDNSNIYYYSATTLIV